MTDRNLKSLENLSLSIGNFIRYWGFRRIHGAIWTQLYLSDTPLTAAELTRRLKVSKALVSPAMSELEKWQLVRALKTDNAKSKFYVANEDINAVIQHVLKIREQKMIAKISDNLKDLKSKPLKEMKINPERLQKVEQMVESAQAMLSLLVRSNDMMFMPNGSNDET